MQHHQRARTGLQQVIGGGSGNGNTSSSTMSMSTVAAPPSLRSWLLEKQGFVNALKYLATAGVLFIPSSFQYYEVAAEGCHSLSQIISFLNHLVLDRVLERSSNGRGGHAGWEGVLVVALQILARVEVLIEKACVLFETSTYASTLASVSTTTSPPQEGRGGGGVAGAVMRGIRSSLGLSSNGTSSKRTRASSAIGGSLHEVKSKVISLIEGAKALCRLALWCKAKKGSMMIRWGEGEGGWGGAAAAAGGGGGRERGDGGGGGVVYDLCQYEVWYRTKIHTSSRHTNTHTQAQTVLPPSSFTLQQQHTPTHTLAPPTHVHTPTYVGRRSGLSLPLSHTHTQTPSPSSVTVCLEATHTHTVELKAPAPFSSLQTASYTPTHTHTHTLPPVHAPPIHATHSSTHVSTQTQTHPRLNLSAEQVLALGEVLYVIRPAVYVWTLHYLYSLENEEGGGEGMDMNQGGGGGGGGEAEDDAFRSSGSSNFSSTTQTDTSPQRAMHQALAICVSLLLEVSSVQLTSLALQMTRDRACPPPQQRSSSTPIISKRQHPFEEELVRRKRALFYYLIRSPIFDKSTLPFLRFVQRLLAQVPFVSSLPTYALNMLQYLNKTHFYNSNS